MRLLSSGWRMNGVPAFQGWTCQGGTERCNLKTLRGHKANDYARWSPLRPLKFLMCMNVCQSRPLWIICKIWYPSGYSVSTYFRFWLKVLVDGSGDFFGAERAIATQFDFVHRFAVNDFESLTHYEMVGAVRCSGYDETMHLFLQRFASDWRIMYWGSSWGVQLLKYFFVGPGKLLFQIMCFVVGWNWYMKNNVVKQGWFGGPWPA